MGQVAKTCLLKSMCKTTSTKASMFLAKWHKYLNPEALCQQLAGWNACWGVWVEWDWEGRFGVTWWRWEPEPGPLPGAWQHRSPQPGMETAASGDCRGDTLPRAPSAQQLGSAGGRGCAMPCTAGTWGSQWSNGRNKATFAVLQSRSLN